MRAKNQTFDSWGVPCDIRWHDRILLAPQLDHPEHPHQAQGPEQAQGLPLIRVPLCTAAAQGNQGPIQGDQTWKRKGLTENTWNKEVEYGVFYGSS